MILNASEDLDKLEMIRFLLKMVLNQDSTWKKMITQELEIAEQTFTDLVKEKSSNNDE